MAAGLLVLYAVLLAVVLLTPTSTQQEGMVRWLGKVLGGNGATPYITGFRRLEMLTNAAIFVPLSFLGSVLWPSYKWRDWTAWALVLSLTVELVQMVLLPDRQPSFADVVANSMGALIGAVAFGFARRMSSVVVPARRR